MQRMHTCFWHASSFQLGGRWFIWKKYPYTSTSISEYACVCVHGRMRVCVHVWVSMDIILGFVSSICHEPNAYLWHLCLYYIWDTLFTNHILLPNTVCISSDFIWWWFLIMHTWGIKINLTLYNKLSREPLYFCLLKHKQVSRSSACPIHSATRKPALLRCVQSYLHFKIVTSISRKRSHPCDMYLPKNSRV